MTNSIVLGVAPWALGAGAVGLALASGVDPVTAVLVCLAGTVTAVLGYSYVIKPAGQAVGIKISAADLEE